MALLSYVYFLIPEKVSSITCDIVCAYGNRRPNNPIQSATVRTRGGIHGLDEETAPTGRN